MANKSSGVSDEEIVAALLTHGTIKEAAAAVNLTPRAIYDRMTDGEFQVIYKSAKTDIVRQAVHKINAHIAAAVDAVANIMQDEETNPATRLQAAQTMLGTAEKYMSRLTAAESAAIAQKEHNEFWKI